MFYFLCEGEKDKAEYTFIKSVIEEFHANEVHEFLAAGSKDNIDSEFDKLSEKFKSGDIFILFFDNIEIIKGRPVPFMLDDMTSICESKGVIFRYTTYYCFEELFLSYTGLSDMLPLKFYACKGELCKLQTSLLMGENYWKEFDLSFWLKMFPNLKSASTREQFSARLLANLTNSIRGNFRIIKASIGLCWVSDCSLLQNKESIKIARDKCASCKYDCKNCTFRKKLEVLDVNSVSSLSLPFSTIFWDSK